MKTDTKNALIETAHNAGNAPAYLDIDMTFGPATIQKSLQKYFKVACIGFNPIGIIGHASILSALHYQHREPIIINSTQSIPIDIEKELIENVFSRYDPTRIKMMTPELPNLEYANFSDVSIYKKSSKKPRIKQKKRAARKSKEQGKARRKQRKK